MLVADVITTNVKNAFKDLYDFDLSQVGVEHPQNPSWGDYSTNAALVASKSLGKSPLTLAKGILQWLQGVDLRDYFEDVSIAGPGFINFALSREYLLLQALAVLVESGKFGSSHVGGGKKIALEHSNVNPNKAAHIGHLRNAVIGQFVERVYEFIGYDVAVQYYSNDLGVQVSTSLLGMEKLRGDLDPANYKKFDHYAWDVYAKISRMLDTDPVLKKELDEMLVKLDNREPEVSQKQSDLSKRILKDNLMTFAALEISYDLIVYESSIKDMLMWEKAFDILKKSSKIYLATSGASKGCWLVKMHDEDSSDSGTDNTTREVEEDKIIVRSNGIPTYTGKDIAYHMWKFGVLDIDFKYDKLDLGNQDTVLYETSTIGDSNVTFKGSDIVMDVVDVRQTYAMGVVRKTLEYLSYETAAQNFIHINYGHVYLSNSTAIQMGFSSSDTSASQIAMSGRKGVGVKIDDFIELVEKSLKNNFGDFPHIKDVRNAVIKFDMLRYDTFQDIVFDIDDALNMKGFTGPYIQYTHARINSLLEKAGYQVDSGSLDYRVKGFNSLELNSSAEGILRTMYKFPEVVMQSAKQYAPNLVCVYLYELCQKFNSFYNDSPILTAETQDIKDFRLFLTASTGQLIKNGLYLLGINAVDRM
jgi:arginyl-tRNA synthetase